MQKYNVLIVDDEFFNINLLKLYISKYCRHIDQVYTATNTEDAIDSYLEHYPEILLLDVQLDVNSTSFEIIAAIPHLHAEVIFVTSHEEYAIAAINTVTPVAYLLKPLKPLDLVGAIDKAIDSIKSKSANTDAIIDDTAFNAALIAIPSANKIDLVHIEDIVYVEADGRYSIFHLIDGTQKISSRNLGEYEKQLNPRLFFRVHHGYLVNLSMVTNINKLAGNYCELKNGKSIPIAKRRQEQLHRFLRIK
jgi:two-component system LytT family response regulator